MPFLILVIPSLQSWISVVQAIRTDDICFLHSSDLTSDSKGCPARLDKPGAWKWDAAILDMCSKLPVMQKTPRHVTSQLSSSYFLPIFLPCTFLNMHYVSSLLSVCPSTLNFVCCCLLAHKYKNQCRTMEDALLGLEEKLKMKNLWPCLQSQMHGSE